MFSDVDFLVDELGDWMTAQRRSDLVQAGPNVLGLISDLGDAEDGELPLVEGVDFGGGDAEIVPQAVEDAANNLALILKAACIAEAQADAERADEHGGLGRGQLLVV
jgi:hypothetical protein